MQAARFGAFLLRLEQFGQTGRRRRRRHDRDDLCTDRTGVASVQVAAQRHRPPGVLGLRQPARRFDALRLRPGHRPPGRLERLGFGGGDARVLANGIARLAQLHVQHRSVLARRADLASQRLPAFAGGQLTVVVLDGGELTFRRGCFPCRFGELTLAKAHVGGACRDFIGESGHVAVERSAFGQQCVVVLHAPFERLQPDDALAVRIQGAERGARRLEARLRLRRQCRGVVEALDRGAVLLREPRMVVALARDRRECRPHLPGAARRVDPLEPRRLRRLATLELHEFGAPRQALPLQLQAGLGVSAPQACGLARIGQHGLPGSQRVELGLCGGDGGRRGVRIGLELPGGGIQIAARIATAFAGQFLHARVHREAQQFLQDASPLPRIALEEAGELALRQDHRVGERVVVEADEALDGGQHLARPRGDWRREAIDDLVELTRAGRRGAADDARDQERAVAHGEPQRHRHAIAAVRDEVLDAAAAHARHAAVQRERNRVEHRALAGAGRPGDGKQRERRQVERRLRVAEAGEALHVDRQRPHASCSSAIAAS